MHIDVCALEMASHGNQLCANCIGTLSFPMTTSGQGNGGQLAASPRCLAPWHIPGIGIIWRQNPAWQQQQSIRSLQRGNPYLPRPQKYILCGDLDQSSNTLFFCAHTSLSSNSIVIGSVVSVGLASILHAHIHRGEEGHARPGWTTSRRESHFK